jgi:hypothetical protein
MTSTTRTAFTTFVSLLAVAGVSMALRAETRRPPRVEMLVLRSISSHWEDKLSIDLKSGRAKLLVFGINVESEDGDPPTDRTRILERELPFSEAQDLRRLTAAADLLKGATSGFELDCSYTMLEAHAGGAVNIFVVTANRSFQSGPREELFLRLAATERHLLGRK